jgi:GT2 family glycosyltransferase
VADSPKVLAIIPVYKNYAQRDRCVDALSKQTVPVEVFIQDNTTDNIGYTKACNRGLREAQRRGIPFSLLINQDCYAEPNAVERMLELMTSKPKCAIAGPMQVSDVKSDEVRHAGCLTAYPAGRHRGGGSRAAGAYSKSEQVPWINGACLFARMESALEFGLMDENMFLIGSDSDWCLTARLRGWEVWYCADACVMHEGGVSTALPPIPTLRIFQNDMQYFRRKWVGTVAHRQLDRPLDTPHVTMPIPQAVQKAAADHQAGRLLDAEIAYRDILDVDPKNVDVLNLLGLLTLHQGWPVPAHDYFAAAVAAAPHIPTLHAHLASTLAFMNQPEEARREFLEAVRLEATSAQVAEGIAAELAKLGYAEDAAAARAKAAHLRQSQPGVGGAMRR